MESSRENIINRTWYFNSLQCTIIVETFCLNGFYSFRNLGVLTSSFQSDTILNNAVATVDRLEFCVFLINDDTNQILTIASYTHSNSGDVLRNEESLQARKPEGMIVDGL